MGLVAWIKNTLGGKTQIDLNSAEFWSLSSSVYVRELAFQSAINLIANSVAKCEFLTYRGNEKIKSDEYYLWNVEPNRNQNSSEFIKKLISKLYENNECLVVVSNSNELLIADSFAKQEYAFYDFVFSKVSVGDYTFDRNFSMSDVLYFKLNNKDIKTLVNGLHNSYGQLLEYSQKAFKKSRGQKGILNIESQAQGDAKFEERLKSLLNEKFKTYFEADSAVLPLTKGYSYNEQDRKTYNADSTRDIRAQIDDIFSFTGRAFGVPPVLLLGEVIDPSKAVNQLLTFCIDPLTDLLSEEINRKRFGKEEYLAGNKMVIDTKAIKHIDLLEVATAVDKLISSGGFCIDDIRVAVGEEPLNTEFSRKHWMTKNYTPAEQAAYELGRSENTE